MNQKSFEWDQQSRDVGRHSEHQPSDQWPGDSDWTDVLSPMLTSDAYRELTRFVTQERETETVFPPPHDVYRAFQVTSYSATKVVILGQDPYHGEGQAHGLSFSVEPGIRLPPSLRNIFRELVEDQQVSMPTNGDLTPWARQGVLLLNTVLTVRSGQANSHRNQGWETFTDFVIQKLNERSTPVTFVLWGKPAERKLRLIDDRHPTVVSAHPSPLSAHRGFLGSRPFSRVNQLLEQLGIEPIDWTLT